MSSILVTDGDERSALAVVRSLGRARHTVIVGATRLRSLAGSSRFASRQVVLPHPLSAPLAFAQAVGAVVRTHQCEVVLPVTDASSLALLAEPEMIAPAVLPMPSRDVFLRVSDKAEVADHARALGIEVPRQLHVAQRKDLDSVTDELRPPLVLKPARSVTGDDSQRRHHGVVHAHDWPQAREAASGLPESAFPLLVQERIIGPGMGVFLLRWNGELLAAFAHRRVREKPPSGGVSVLCESIALDPKLLDRSLALLSRFDWNGVAMVEYKMDARSSSPFLMEINGRFWGSLQLAIDAGVDFPALLVDAALGRPVVPVTDWRIGVSGRWFWGDVDQLAARLRRPARALHLPPGSPGRLATLLDFVRGVVPPWHDQVFRWGDVGPGVLELSDRVRGVLRRTRRVLTA